MNRGNVHWDDEISKLIAMAPTRFIRVKADRDLESFPDYVKAVIGTRKISGVIDFSCYNLEDAKKGVASVP